MRVSLLLVLFALIMFQSCSVFNNQQRETEQEYVVFPNPPDTARIQFLTSISNSIQVTGGRNSFEKFVLGEEQQIDIAKPYGVNMYKGKIYVAYPSGKCLYIIDLGKNRFDIFTPKGKGTLKMPINCYVDDEGKIYVADSKRRQVVVFDNSLKYIASFGEAEDFKPTDVVVGDEIYVCDLKGHKIHIYDKETYKLQKSFPEADTEDEFYLFSPTNICLSEEVLYVSDMGASKMKMFTQDGKYISSLGSYGKNIGQFVRPKGIAVDNESNLYVVDASFENIQIFNKNNQLLMFFGGHYKAPGDMWLPADVHINYDNNKYFEKYIDPEYKLKYLIIVTNQYGPDKINIYGAIEPK